MDNDAAGKLLTLSQGTLTCNFSLRSATAKKMTSTGSKYLSP